MNPVRGHLPPQPQFASSPPPSSILVVSPFHARAIRPPPIQWLIMALAEMRSLLPTGGVGRIINGFIFERHPDAIAWQRGFRVACLASAKSKPLGTIYDDKDDSGDANFTFCKQVARGAEAYGWVTHCPRCKDPVRITVDEIHEGAHISHPCAWYGKIPCGWDCIIKEHVRERWKCQCNVMNTLGEVNWNICTDCADGIVTCAACGLHPYGRTGTQKPWAPAGRSAEADDGDRTAAAADAPSPSKEAAPAFSFRSPASAAPVFSFTHVPPPAAAAAAVDPPAPFTFGSATASVPFSFRAQGGGGGGGGGGGVQLGNETTATKRC